MCSPQYTLGRLNLRAFSEQIPLIFKWVEHLGFDVVVNSTQDIPSHYALRRTQKGVLHLRGTTWFQLS